MATTMAAPDGGWGWMIVLGVSIINFSVLPLVATFGLLFEEKFKDLGILSAKTSFLLHLSAAITCVFGIVASLLLHKWSFRTVAFIGSTSMCIGIILTAQASSYPVFIFTYCLLVGLGHGLLIPTTSLAVNTYFAERRSTAMGLVMGAIGLCQVLSPLAVDGMLNEYNVSGAGLILGAIALNSFIGAMLLRPLRHVKKEEDSALLGTEEQIGECGNRGRHDANGMKMHPNAKRPPPDRISYDTVTNDRNFESTSVGFIFSDQGEGSEHGEVHGERGNGPAEDNAKEFDCTPSEDVHPERIRKRLSFKSEDDMLRTTDECKAIPVSEEEQVILPRDISTAPITDSEAPRARSGQKVGGFLYSALKLSLLRDGVFWNIMIGMALAFVAELNFNVMFPFILSDYMKLPRSDVAVVMTVLASVDVVSRVLIPLAADRWKWNARILFVTSLLGTSVARSILNNVDKTYVSVLVLSVVFGVFKGLRAVFQALILPNYVSLEELAAATGIVMVFNGITSLALGPVLGVIRDYSKDYSLSLDVTSGLSMACVLLWAAEGILCTRNVNRGDVAVPA